MKTIDEYEVSYTRWHELMIGVLYPG